LAEASGTGSGTRVVRRRTSGPSEIGHATAIRPRPDELLQSVAERGEPPDLVELTRRPGPGPHRAVIDVDGQRTMTLADLPPARGGLLFVGLNPSVVSVKAGHYHQGQLGRVFWRRLIRASILPADTPLASADDALVAAGHGITDLIKRPSPRDNASDMELRAGVGPLWQKVALWRPAAVVFVYKRAAESAAGRRLNARWGQLQGVALGGRPRLPTPGPYASAEDVAAGLNFLRNLAAAVAD
jgi:double-stranded uracil-DNA glycosylase